MAKLSVSETNVPTLLQYLESGEWLTPEFQRDFVWNNAAVIGLVDSIIDSRPIGMVTLWEQEDDTPLELEHISIPDYDPLDKRTGLKYFGDNKDRPGRCFAILDGRQRSTAIALAFGGLKAESGKFKHSGGYFLDASAKDTNDRIKYFATKDIEKNNYNNLSVCINKGLFPLKSDDPNNIYGQWMTYLQEINNTNNYSSDQLPDADELSRRNDVLKNAFNGIINTKVAVYTVPKEYSLANICEIFETLNTTGTKVSTVDLIHSWIYSDTAKGGKTPLLLREKIDDLGELEGAIGWSSTNDRPELIAQFVAACHVALDNKPDPRPVGKAKKYSISSVKSSDLLAIPTIFWEKVFSNDETFASFIGDFQDTIAGGPFNLNNCPYPASAAIYVALRWYHEFDLADNASWAIEQLNSVYSAFYWRNVLTNRYDQGFLTQIGTDLNDMKDFLSGISAETNQKKFKDAANSWLDSIFRYETEITLSSCVEICSDGSVGGALRKATLLPMYARSTVDILDTDIDISFGSNEVQLHHIFPKDWCRNNKTGSLSKYLDPLYANKDWVNSAANLFPMSRVTNLKWRKKNPAQFIDEEHIKYEDNSELWQSYFVTAESYALLAKGEKGLAEFWNERAMDIGKYLFNSTKV